MSNWGIEDDPSLATPTNDGPKALRDAYDALKQQNKDLADGLAAVNKQLRETAVASTLGELGIPATAATQYTGEADPAKVREWATTMQSLFGGGGGAPAPTPTTDTTPPVTLEGDAAAQLQRMTEAGQSGTPLGSMEAAQAGIGDATDLTGLLSAWQNIK